MAFPKIENIKIKLQIRKPTPLVPWTSMARISRNTVFFGTPFRVAPSSGNSGNNKITNIYSIFILYKRKNNKVIRDHKITTKSVSPYITGNTN